MIIPVFALGISEQVTAYAVKGLTVVGAGLVGYFAGGMIVWGIDKFLLKQTTPAPLKRTCQVLLGLIAAIVMAMILFGEGGNGLFGGGGDGKGSPGASASDQKSNPPTNDQPKTLPPVPPSKQTDLKPGDAVIHITVYGGSVVKDDRFYQIESDPVLKTLQELKEAILARKRSEPRGVAIILQQPADRNAVGGDPRLVSQVTDWAQREGIFVLGPNK